MSQPTMTSSWKLKENNGIAVLELDVPETEVNVLTSENLAELKNILSDIAKRREIKALLITSAKKRIFIAGADIREIQGISTEREAFQKAEQGKEIFQMLEDLKCLTMTVINGACLGGGFELALSTDFRVASFSDNVKIGLPEVKLGILPGFGGSIRLPRCVGLLKGLPLILTGKICSAKDALRNGMVDRLLPEIHLEDDAVEFAREILEKGKNRFKRRKKKKIMNWFLEDTPIGRSLVFSRARKDVQKNTKGFYPAPFEIIKLVEKTYGKSAKPSFKLESEHFSKLGATDVSKNLIQLFFLSEKYKKLKWTQSDVSSKPVRKVGVVGAGVMGGGIAQLVSCKNIPVRVKDINEKALAGALKEASRIYQGALKRRRVSKYDVEFKMGLISVGLDHAGVKLCDFIEEAVVEDMNIKKKVFRELSQIAAPDAVLASNTSSLSVTEMAEVCQHPERVIGLHFFNPVNRMPLVEVICTPQTSDGTLERTVRFARGLGKTVIVVKDSRGFLVNRLLLPYMNEAAYLLQQGMPAENIDRVAEKFGMPMGPIELVDQVGIDVGYKVAHVLHEAFGDRMKVPPILEHVKNQGLLGKKSGKGFYLYKGKKRLSLNPAVQKAFMGKVDVSEEDALKRMIYIMINEAARCLEEGVVDSPATVDVGMVFGTGFPPFRSGLLRYADSVGIENIVRDLERFQKSVSSERFTPCDYLRSHKKFYA